MPLFEQVAVLREVDLHYKWAPFCSSSMTLKDLDKLDTVGWFVIGLPQFGLARDACFRAFGCDCMMEDGSFFLVGQGVEDREEGIPYGEEYFLEDMDGIRIPNPPTRLGSGRVTIRNFSAVVHVLSPTTVRTVLVGNFNPNLPLIPQTLLDFIMRKMCGVVLYKLQHAAKKACTDPVQNAHAKRMRQHEAFYKGWLIPKFQSYCDHVGWTMPPVPALTLTDEQLELESAGSHRSVPLRTLSTLETVETIPSLPHPASAPNLDDIHPTESALAKPFDSASIISSVTGVNSTFDFRNNPISKLLREMEEKTQQEKARKIEEGRQRTAARLKPKEIPEDNKSRLQQLKAAKYRRIRSSSSSLPVQQAVAAPVTPIQQADVLTFVNRFHNHGRRTRFVVISILVVILLVTLYSDVLLGFEPKLRKHDNSVWTNSLLDIATILYLSMTAAIHFVLCTVSFVYAYENLSLGTKTGNRSKEYYGARIRFLVAGTSGAIVTFSVVSAIARMWFRLGFWYLLQATDWLKCNFFGEALSDQRGFPLILDSVPKPIQSMTAAALSQVSGFLGWTVSTGKSGVVLFLHWFVIIFVRSNFVGRAVATLLLQIAGFFSNVSNAWDNYVTNVITMHTDDDAELASWRGIAIDTARPLLTYTAIFLLSILILFSFSARGESKKSGECKDDSAVSSVASDVFPLKSEAAPAKAAAHPSQQYYAQISSISIQADIIPEDSVASSSVGSSDTRRKKRLQFLFRKRTNTTADGYSIQSEQHRMTPTVKRMQSY